MAELKPCQCGKRANMHLSDTNELRVFWVKCDCGMRTDYFPTAGMAAKCWNTRNDEAARQEGAEDAILKSGIMQLKIDSAVSIARQEEREAIKELINNAMRIMVVRRNFA